MSRAKTPFEMAQRVAHLMGGNGLTTEQSVLLIAHELGDWKAGMETVTVAGLLWTRKSGSREEPQCVGAPACDWLSDPRGHMFGERYVAFLEDMKARGFVA